MQELNANYSALRGAQAKFTQSAEAVALLATEASGANRDTLVPLTSALYVPARVVPYVSAGIGITWYSFRQSGDFVDYQSLDVFGTTLESSAWAPSAYGALGVEYSVRARTSVVAEARYDAASARMSSDFSGFNRIDLSGVAATLGLMFRF